MQPPVFATSRLLVKRGSSSPKSLEGNGGPVNGSGASLLVSGLLGRVFWGEEGNSGGLALVGCLSKPLRKDGGVAFPELGTVNVSSGPASTSAPN